MEDPRHPYRAFTEKFELSNSPNATRSKFSTHSVGNSEAVSLVSLRCPVSFARQSLIGSPGARTHVCPSRQVVFIPESEHSARGTSYIAHCTLYSVHRKGLRSLTPFLSSVFTFLRRCSSSDNSPHVSRVRPRYPYLAYPCSFMDTPQNVSTL
jgi:hypothetical protein